MPQFQKLILLLCAIFVIAVLGVAQASAGIKASPRPAVTVNKALSVSNIAVVKCWASPWWIQWHRRSHAGLSVWRYRLTIDRFCWTGTKIAAIHSFRSVKIDKPLWDFCCHLSQTRRWNGTWSFRRWTEGKFVWAGPIGLAVVTPEIWFTVRGDGWHDAGAVGN